MKLYKSRDFDQYFTMQMYYLPYRIICELVLWQDWIDKIIEGIGASPPYVKFWAVFIFCSDLPNFWYASYTLIGKHLSIFLFHWFSLHFREITYAKNLIEHNRVLLFLLQQRVAKKAARKRNVFFAYIISQKEEKTSEKEKIK